MSETILKALMRLFAIIAEAGSSDESEQEQEGEKKDVGRTVVESYLKQQLNQELVDEYLKLFDEYLALHHSKKGKKRLSANSVKVLAICEQVNEELRQEQKMLVLLKLLEFINFNSNITEYELEFVKTVSEVFNISKDEYANCKALVLEKPEMIPGKEQVLIIDGQNEAILPEFKHLSVEHLVGMIVMMHIPSTNMYAFGYVGDDALYLNSNVISPKRVYVLVKGSTIRSRKFNPIYYSDIVGAFLAKSERPKIVFSAVGVEFYFKNSKNGLHPFNFSEETGQLIGVMGGSGAGKSTLLNILNGNIKPQKGHILINGFDIHNDKDKIKGVIGFVPQDDLLIEELTVFQNLYYNGKLCFANYTDEQLTEACNKVLLDLDLFEIRNLKVGGPLNKFISGGQRKRLNIALELIREPDIMFVDEPTSGLSSMDSEMVMDLLKEITLKGKLAIINIHQPSSDIYKLFDKILILDKGGYPIYFGNPGEAVVYFKRLTNHANAEESECASCGNVNPEQVLQIVEQKVVDEYGKLTKNRKTSAKEWNVSFLEKIGAGFKEKTYTSDLPPNNFKIPGKFRQFLIFTTRDVLSKLTNRQYILMNFLEAPILAVILGYFTKYISGDEYNFSENENLFAYLFMAVVVALFLGMSVAAEEIIRDRKILQREAFLNLSRFSYVNSKILIMFTLSAIQVFTFLLVGNFVLGIKGMTFNYFIVLFATSCFANLIGLNISSALNSVVTIYILIPFILVPELLLSGVIVKFEKLHRSVASYSFVPVVGDLMTSRWAFEALAVTQFKDNQWQKNFFDIEKEKSYHEFRFNYLIPELVNRLDQSDTYINEKTGSAEEFADNLMLLRNEIKKIEKTAKKKSFGKEKLNALTPEKFDAKTVEYTRKYLDKKKKEHSNLFNKASNKSDSVYNVLLKTYGDKETLIKLKEDYNNISLADLVTNKNSFETLVEENNRIVQLTKPIFKDPESNYGRAHFYAPYKNIFGYHMDTLYFNVAFIWLTSLFMYIALVFNWLRKALEFSDNAKIFKKKGKD